MAAYFLTLFVCAWLAATLLALFVSSDRVRKLLSLVVAPLFVLLMLVSGQSLLGWQRLLASSAGLLYMLKATILLRYTGGDIRTFSLPGLCLYMSLWPGMNPEPFRARVQSGEDGRRFARGFAFMCVGVVLFVATAAALPSLAASLRAWLMLAACLLTIHLGYADVLTSCLRLLGWNVGPLFEQPLGSLSLQDFWSRRWNLAFVEMDKILFWPPLRRVCTPPLAVFLVFVISGLLHDLCISYSAMAGWGMPSLYFCIHGVAVWTERRLQVASSWPRPLAILWTWAWLLLPLPLLVTQPFQQSFLVPALASAHALLCQHDLQWYLGWALWLAAGGNFLTLAAGLQVPKRLHWQQELAQLSTFNRKIFLNYALYVGLMIVAFGVLTIVLHDELLSPGRAACALCILMGLFWGLRVLVDIFWFEHRDWPQGPMFVIGHACLTALFVALTTVYLGLAILHCF